MQWHHIFKKLFSCVSHIGFQLQYRGEVNGKCGEDWFGSRDTQAVSVAVTNDVEEQSSVHHRAHWTVITCDMGKARLATVKTCGDRETQRLGESRQKKQTLSAE